MPLPRADTTSLPHHITTGSGAQDLMGYKMDLGDPAGGAVVRLHVEAKHLNRNGMLQGGIHATFLDAPAGFGDVITTGHVTGGGHKIIYAELDIRKLDGRLLSRGSGVFKRVGTLPTRLAGSDVGT